MKRGGLRAELAAASLLALLVLSSAGAGGVTFGFDQRLSSLTFKVTAPFVTAVGLVREYSGTVQADEVRQFRNPRLDLTVNLKSLFTKHAERDAKMMEVLEVEKFPTASLHIERIEGIPEAPAPGQPAEVTLRGTLSLHGVSKPIEVRATATYDGATLIGRGSAQFRLSSFNIERPRVLLVTLRDEVEVFFTIRALPR